MPMDFEYDNGNGPVDASSPWVSHAAKKRKLLSFESSHPHSEQQVQKLNEGPPFGHATIGTHSVFDSPSKNTFATPNQLQLSEPNGQRFLFSQQKPLPQTPQNNKLWNLRTPQSIADSSGGETPTDTPAHGSDAPTPDTQLALTMGALSHGEQKSGSKRASILKSLGWNKSPTKEKSAREKPYTRKAENKVMKRRAHKSRSRHNEYDSDTESPFKDAPVQQAAPPIGFAAKIPGVLAWVEAHPNLPSVLSYYMQFMVNAAIYIFILWIAYAAYTAIVADIDHEAGIKVRDVMHEIAICAQEYQRNGCEPNPVPAVESLCQNWRKCKDRDAYKVARASVGARTFATIFNSFVDEFSYKSMVFFLLLLSLHWKYKALGAAVADKVSQLQKYAAASAPNDQSVHVPFLQASPYLYPLHGSPALLPFHHLHLLLLITSSKTSLTTDPLTSSSRPSFSSAPSTFRIGPLASGARKLSRTPNITSIHQSHKHPSDTLAVVT